MSGNPPNQSADPPSYLEALTDAHARFPATTRRGRFIARRREKAYTRFLNDAKFWCEQIRTTDSRDTKSHKEYRYEWYRAVAKVLKRNDFFTRLEYCFDGRDRATKKLLHDNLHAFHQYRIRSLVQTEVDTIGFKLEPLTWNQITNDETFSAWSIAFKARRHQPVQPARQVVYVYLAH